MERIAQLSVEDSLRVTVTNNYMAKTDGRALGAVQRGQGADLEAMVVVQGLGLCLPQGISLPKYVEQARQADANLNAQLLDHGL
jgi:hypothetical protein